MVNAERHGLEPPAIVAGALPGSKAGCAPLDRSAAAYGTEAGIARRERDGRVI